MCFYENEDADWSPEVYKEETRIAGNPIKCHECGEMMDTGQEYLYAFGQEYELCRLCEDDEDITDCEHDYGESYEYRCCQTCQKLLMAIEAVEADEKCPQHLRRPCLGELGDVFYEHQDADKYRDRALVMFPELAGHKFFEKIHN